MPTPTTSFGETASPVSAETSPVSAETSPLPTAKSNGRDAFVIPIVHINVPEAVVNIGFWGALAGAAALGAVELPLAALIGAGVLVARHRHSR